MWFEFNKYKRIKIKIKMYNDFYIQFDFISAWRWFRNNFQWPRNRLDAEMISSRSKPPIPVPQWSGRHWNRSKLSDHRPNSRESVWSDRISILRIGQRCRSGRRGSGGWRRGINCTFRWGRGRLFGSVLPVSLTRTYLGLIGLGGIVLLLRDDLINKGSFRFY